MKKNLLIVAAFFLLYQGNLKAQITLDTAFVPQQWLGMGFWIVQISETETKYYVSDTVTNTFSLYNMNWTPFLTNIAVPRPFMPYGYQVLYVTRALFDCDTSNIEYLYVVVNAPCNISSVYVMRTDGTQLLRVDSARCEYCAGGCLLMSDVIRPIVNTSDGHARLFIDYPMCGSNRKFYVYSLCGNIPEPCPCSGIGGILTETQDMTNLSQSFVRVFPNPSSNSITFEVSPPDNMHEFELIIFDSESKVLSRKNVNSGYYKFTIDTKNFSSGNYIYSLCTKDKAYQTGKFIINK